MGREGGHVDAEHVDVDADLAEGLHRVGVEEGARPLVGDPGRLGDRLYGADLVVRQHEGHQHCLGAEGRGQRLEIHDALGVHWKEGDPEALLLEPFRRVQHGVMLDRGGDDVVAASPHRPGPERAAFEGQVVGLGPPRSEDDLPRSGADGGGGALPGFLEALLGLPPCRVHAGGVPERTPQVGQHGLDDLVEDRGRGRVVEVAHHTIIRAALLAKPEVYGGRCESARPRVIRVP